MGNINHTSDRSKAPMAVAVLKILLSGRRITHHDALAECGCWALSQRVTDLRYHGNINIQSQMVKRGKSQVAEYWMDADDIELTRVLLPDVESAVLTHAASRK